MISDCYRTYAERKGGKKEEELEKMKLEINLAH